MFSFFREKFGLLEEKYLLVQQISITLLYECDSLCCRTIAKPSIIAVLYRIL